MLGFKSIYLDSKVFSLNPDSLSTNKHLKVEISATVLVFSVCHLEPPTLERREQWEYREPSSDSGIDELTWELDLT